jgi:viologen exporter family transport system permease protein
MRARSRSVRTDSRPLGPARLSWLFVRVGVMNDLQYRVNFFIQLFQSLLALGTGLLVLALIFSHTTELEGWSRPELLAIMGVFTIMGGVIRSVIQPNMQRLLADVRQGTLDFVLTKPADSQVLVSVRDVRVWPAVDVLTGGVVLGVALYQLQERLGVAHALAFVTMIALGAVMIYCFWLAITTGAFWLVRMDEIQELFDGVYRAGMYPVGIYPTWLRFGLTFLVPIAFAITVPAEAVTSRLGWGTVALALVVAVLLVVVSRAFWKLGLRHYSGASS